MWFPGGMSWKPAPPSAPSRNMHVCAAEPSQRDVDLAAAPRCSLCTGRELTEEWAPAEGLPLPPLPTQQVLRQGWE